MAHNSKKWITCYDGTVKRSNDRTKKDYYRDLNWWDEYYVYTRRTRVRYGKNTEVYRNFCPQCTHVQKYIVEQENEYIQRREELKREYDALYGDAIDAWKKYNQEYCNRYYISESFRGHTYNRWVYIVVKPITPEPPQFWRWIDDRLPKMWNYDIRSYLCFKCERKYDAKREMWHRHPGCKRNYTHRVKGEYQNYKNEVKHIMNRAKYDDDLYEDIPVYKHGWLD